MDKKTQSVVCDCSLINNIEQRGYDVETRERQEVCARNFITATAVLNQHCPPEHKDNHVVFSVQSVKVSHVPH